jgi:cytochrome P450
MRLYPPAWLVARSVAEPVQIGDYDIEPGTIVFICPFTMHRDERFWPNPEGFLPERFLGEAERAIPRCAYIPFITGPRQCIGAGFAMMEAQIILALVARRFALDLVPGHPVVAEPLVTLRPRHGIRMRLRDQPSSRFTVSSENAGRQIA